MVLVGRLIRYAKSTNRQQTKASIPVRHKDGLTGIESASLSIDRNDEDPFYGAVALF